MGIRRSPPFAMSLLGSRLCPSLGRPMRRGGSAFAELPTDLATVDRGAAGIPGSLQSKMTVFLP
ncbi:MAG: hypothetical protein Kow00109_16720 [Acidobacteriota bacterium]